MSKIIEAKKIFKNFGKRQLLIDANFKIYKGEIVCFIGRNGTGKTTLLNIMSGTVSKNRGEIVFFNNAQQEISFFYQENILDESLKLADIKNVISKWTIKNNKNLKFLEFLYERLNLHKIEKIAIRKISGGEKQKIALFQTLANQSQIVFLDEFSNNLDIQTINEVKTILLELVAKYQMSIVMASHKVEEIRNFADRIFIIKDRTIQKEILVKNFSDEQLESLFEKI